MNNIFKVIWNHATQTWTAVGELASAKGKSKSVKLAVISTALLAVAGGANAEEGGVIGPNNGSLSLPRVPNNGSVSFSGRVISLHMHMQLMGLLLVIVLKQVNPAQKVMQVTLI